MGISGEGISSKAEPSSSSRIIAIIPPLSMLSKAKSQKPLCSKGNAEEGELSWADHSNSRREKCGNIFDVNTCEKTERKESSMSAHKYSHLMYQICIKMNA